MRAGLSCFVHSGDAPISLEWLKDGLPLRHAHVHSPQGGFMSALSLASLTPQDDGNYTCRASNAWASASYSAVLRVKGEGHGLYMTCNGDKTADIAVALL